MGIREDVFRFEQLLSMTIDEAMQVEVADAAKRYISDAVETEVYDVYDYYKYRKIDTKNATENVDEDGFLPETSAYVRNRMDGGLADPEQMEAKYDWDTQTLEVYSTRRDTEWWAGRPATNRLVADVVESGKEYNRNTVFSNREKPWARPFHKVAEERMGQFRVLENILTRSLRLVGFTLKKGE